MNPKYQITHMKYNNINVNNITKTIKKELLKSSAIKYCSILNFSQSCFKLEDVYVKAEFCYNCISALVIVNFNQFSFQTLQINSS